MYFRRYLFNSLAIGINDHMGCGFVCCGTLSHKFMDAVHKIALKHRAAVGFALKAFRQRLRLRPQINAEGLFMHGLRTFRRHDRSAAQRQHTLYRLPVMWSVCLMDGVGILPPPARGRGPAKLGGGQLNP